MKRLLLLLLSGFLLSGCGAKKQLTPISKRQLHLNKAQHYEKLNNFTPNPDIIKLKAGMQLNLNDYLDLSKLTSKLTDSYPLKQGNLYILVGQISDAKDPYHYYSDLLISSDPFMSSLYRGDSLWVSGDYLSAPNQVGVMLVNNAIGEKDLAGAYQIYKVHKYNHK